MRLTGYQIGLIVFLFSATVNFCAYLLDGLLFNCWLSGMFTGMALTCAIEIIVE